MKFFCKVRNGALVATLALVPGGLTSSLAHADQGQEGWEFIADVYLWGANIDIEAASGSNSEIRFTDIVEDMEFGGMAVLAARHDNGCCGQTSSTWILTTILRRRYSPGWYSINSA